jgi:hypothetical protein
VTLWVSESCKIYANHGLFKVWTKLLGHGVGLVALKIMVEGSCIGDDWWTTRWKVNKNGEAVTVVNS